MIPITERWPGAAEHEGPVPANWQVEDTTRNEHYHFLLYKAPGGKLFYTKRKLKKEGWPRYDLRQENGMTYARARYRRKPYEAH